MSAYPWVPAPDNWSRGSVPVKAIVVHMAEGGGTVQWLLRDDGNSSHYVVEYSGRIVQMVKESRAAGSINPLRLRTTDDAPFTYLGQRIVYGATAARRVLGAHWSNPNQAVIAIETEGFAGKNTAPRANPLGGPNDAQRSSLRKLIADVRSRHGDIPVLAHRDHQDWKACPGKRIPWPDWGGHAAAAVAAPEPEETPMLGFKILASAPGTVTVTGTGLVSIIRLRDGVRIDVSVGEVREAFARVALLEPLDGHAGDRTNGFLIGRRLSDPAESANLEAAFLLATNASFESSPPADAVAVNAALDYVAGPAQAVLTAIQEARR